MNADERLVALLAEHNHPGEFLSVLGQAWLVCSCGERIEIQVVKGKAKAGKSNDGFRAHLAAVIRDAGYVHTDALARVEALLPSGPRPSVNLHSIGAWDLGHRLRAALAGEDS